MSDSVGGLDSLEPIIHRVKKFMEMNMSDQITNQIQSENLAELSDYYEKAKMSDGNAISKITSSLVGHIMSNLPQRFVQVAFENILIEMEDKKPNIKFDVAFELEPITPYVEFIVKISGKTIKSEKVKFEFNASGAFKDLEINMSNSKQKTLYLGTLESDFSLSLVDLPFVNMQESKELYHKDDVTVDLSGISV